MTDETAIAFELPHVRAAATAGAMPHDRISVRDYMREVEIGAFLSERGVTQRIRFNVVLEVAAHVAAQDDDVDKVISYDTIINAIEQQLGTERINLLETLAERVAERCLTDRRAIRVFVRIEKLDRIPGALGVEIVRMRPGTDAAPLRPAMQSEEQSDCPVPEVVLVAALAEGLRDNLAADTPRVVFVPAIPVAITQTGEAARRIALLAYDQGAWAFAANDPRYTVVSSRTELDWALRQGLICVWAPSKIVLDATDPPADDTPQVLARWFADLVGAEAPTEI
ncbi:dihydroneopterin aldolase [Monaibacterium marinum]|uniref:dihydroneopterin aldolase n=1 Tax=Pontivivens marinum TaxID=1690039 RepID=A0A2C9CQI5_9RHOB|nr:dihydroneopterin aldolase [Monaibacterium marinum]SOH93467.1 dihydroneopterin aldolase [Monaibacterium marinum]